MAASEHSLPTQPPQQHWGPILLCQPDCAVRSPPALLPTKLARAFRPRACTSRPSSPCRAVPLPHCPLAMLPLRRWYRDPSLPVHRTEITRFPHAVLEIKLSMAEGEAPPDWVAELVDSGEGTAGVGLPCWVPSSCGASESGRCKDSANAKRVVWLTDAAWGESAEPVVPCAASRAPGHPHAAHTTTCADSTAPHPPPVHGLACHSPGLLTEVHKFSKFIHGTATLFPDMVQAVPYWVDDESGALLSVGGGPSSQGTGALWWAAGGRPWSSPPSARRSRPRGMCDACVL